MKADPPQVKVGFEALDEVFALPVEALRVREAGGGVKVELAPGRALRLDGEGRWITARIGPFVLRRRVDGGIVFAQDPEQAPARDADGEVTQGSWVSGTTRFMDASPESPWHTVVARLAGALAEALAENLPEGLSDTAALRLDRDRALELLQQASRRGPESYRAQARDFAQAYPEPVPILPPDRYRDLVVLPAVGCPHAACTFCAWYADATFRAFDLKTLELHLARLQGLFGSGAAARDGIFLGSASAFSVTDERLQPLIKKVTALFGLPARGLAGFLEPDHAPPRDASAWAALHEAGVVRVVLGLETGSPSLRARLGKPAQLGRFARTVQAIRAGGIGCGITVLCGIARPEETQAHRAQTVAFLEGLALGAGDLIYLSPWDGAADPEAALEEAKIISAAIGEVSAAKRAPYALDRYRYFA